MMKKLILTLVLVVLTAPAFAAGTSAVVEVNGMVCDFCARSLEKLFGKEDAVENINVDLDAATVTINIKDGQELSDEKIAELITYSGYDVGEINRTDADSKDGE